MVEQRGKTPGQVAIINLKITITVSILVIIFGLISILTYIFLPNILVNKNNQASQPSKSLIDDIESQKKDDIRDVISFTLSTIGIGATIISVFYAAESLSRNIKITSENNQENLRFREEDKERNLKWRKEDKALSYISLWNNSSQLQPVKEYYSKLHEKKQKERNHTYKSLIEEDFKEENGFLERRKVIDLLNFLEELSLGVNQDLIDEEIIKDFFEYIIPKHWEVFGEWIIQERDSNNIKYKNLYCQMEILSQKWNNKNRN